MNLLKKLKLLILYTILLLKKFSNKNLIIYIYIYPCKKNGFISIKKDFKKSKQHKLEVLVKTFLDMKIFLLYIFLNFGYFQILKIKNK